MLRRGGIDPASSLYIERYLQDSKLELEADEVEAIELEECVYGFDPRNHIGKYVEE